MLNWDDPLAPPILRMPEPNLESAVTSIESVSMPVDLDIQPTPGVKHKPDNLQTQVINPVVAKPVNADDKRVVNGLTDINQLAPFKYPWAWEYFLNANKNHWTPLDINMTQDVHDYQHKLTLEERHVYENVLSYLTTSDILAMRNIGLAVMEKMTAPELQITRRGRFMKRLCIPGPTSIASKPSAWIRVKFIIVTALCQKFIIRSRYVTVGSIPCCVPISI